MELVWGKNPIEEILKAKKRKVKKVYYTPTHSNREWINHLNIDSSISLEEIPSAKLDQKLGHTNHQGVVIETSPYQYFSLEDFFNQKKQSLKIFILDSIQDPHNLGAICRSSYCFGIDAIIIPDDRAVDINSTVIKTSAGACEYLNVIKVKNLANCIDRLKDNGFWVYYADKNADQAIDQYKIDQKVALILGNEHKGVRDLLKKKSDGSIGIDFSESFDSLNVAQAATVFAFSFFNQSKN
jgi:23S rRNA (guanosine2251-2'-O)-methyltransferase